MKLYIFKLFIVLTICCLVFACTKSEYEYPNNDKIEFNSITGIKLKLNHYNLLADGKAEIEIKPFLYKTQDSVKVIDDRIGDDWVKYFTTSGVEVSRYFSTTDESLIGETIDVYATANGNMSDTVSFTIIEPLKDDEYEEVTFPVIFHICQTEDEIYSFGGKFDGNKVNNLINRMNNVFSGNISKNATGVDTKIRFKAAMYNPAGELLEEPGINRIVTEDTIAYINKYNGYIKTNFIDWPHSKYLNIWLISDKDGAYKYFSYDVTRECIPSSLYPETDITEKPQGITLEEVDMATWDPEPTDLGIKYKLQLLNQFQFKAGTKYDNDFMFYLGQYFGLLITHNVSDWGAIPDDYCDDTFGYKSDWRGKNKKTLKETPEGYLFTSENIMDDQTGLHRSVSKDQTKRIRWIIENCPERSAWKSDFAFSGVE